MLYYFRNLKVKERKNMQISKDTVIGTILDSAPETAPFFLEMGMHCLGCPSARSETVAQACMVHGVNADDLVSKINAFLAENK
jgi:hybrid cluster-associated redox disulfide protein